MTPEKAEMLREALTIDTPGKTAGCSFLVPPNCYTASAVTLTPAKMLIIQSPDFSCVIHKTPRLGIKVMANLAQVVAGRLGPFGGRPERRPRPPRRRVWEMPSRRGATGRLAPLRTGRTDLERNHPFRRPALNPRRGVLFLPAFSGRARRAP